jgi:hypothetical protein
MAASPTSACIRSPLSVGVFGTSRCWLGMAAGQPAHRGDRNAPAAPPSRSSPGTAQRDLARRARLQRGSVGSQQALQRRMAAATQRFQRSTHVAGVLYLPAIPGRVQAPDALAPARLVGLLRAMLRTAEADVQRLLAMQAPRPADRWPRRPSAPRPHGVQLPRRPVAAGNGIGFGLRSQQHLARAISRSSPASARTCAQPRPPRRQPARPARPTAPHLHGHRQQCLPIVLQHLRRW